MIGLARHTTTVGLILLALWIPETLGVFEDSRVDVTFGRLAIPVLIAGAVLWLGATMSRTQGRSDLVAATFCTLGVTMLTSVVLQIALLDVTAVSQRSLLRPITALGGTEPWYLHVQTGIVAWVTVLIFAPLRSVAIIGFWIGMGSGILPDATNLLGIYFGDQIGARTDWAVEMTVYDASGTGLLILVDAIAVLIGISVARRVIGDPFRV